MDEGKIAKLKFRMLLYVRVRRRTKWQMSNNFRAPYCTREERESCIQELVEAGMLDRYVEQRAKQGNDPVIYEITREGLVFVQSNNRRYF